jgi:Mce-associated membrane protein
MARHPTAASPAADSPATDATASAAPADAAPDGEAPDSEALADPGPAGPALGDEAPGDEAPAGATLDSAAKDSEAVADPAPDDAVLAEPGPDDEVLAGPGPDGAAPAGKEPPPARRHRVPLLLGGAAVVLAAFAVVAGIQAHDLRQQRASNNVALTDAAATSQVRQQVTSAINTIFSYNYADIPATRSAAQHLLTGPAVRQYDSLFKLVQQDAPAQHLVLTTKVTNSGVELLVGNRARLLIFADQRDTRKTTSQTTYAGTMFAVNAVHTGSRWKIESIDTFSGGS